MKILIDAMSGDNAPLEILKGAEWAKREFKDHSIMLVGDENVISDVAVKNEIDISGIEIIHAASVITMEDTSFLETSFPSINATSYTFSAIPFSPSCSTLLSPT